LTAETATLDAARASLRAGQAGDALATLDSFAVRFPSGALAPEAGALRVEALLASGDRAAAEAVGRALVATYPRTSAAYRARALFNW
jgi:TolA-binding protein